MAEMEVCETHVSVVQFGHSFDVKEVDMVAVGESMLLGFNNPLGRDVDHNTFLDFFTVAVNDLQVRTGGLMAHDTKTILSSHSETFHFQVCQQGTGGTGTMVR